MNGKMTKKMLAVALMAGSVLVLAGCNKTPAETENEVVSPDASGVVIDVDATSGATMDDSAASSFDETSLTGDESLTSGADTASVDEAADTTTTGASAQ